MEFLQIFNSVIQLLSLGILIITVLQMVRELKLTREIQQQNLTWNKKVLTQTVLVEKINSSESKLVGLYFNKLNHWKPVSLNFLLEKFNEDNLLQHQLKIRLNKYENLGMGIKEGIYSEKLIKLSRKGAISSDYIQYLNYILHSRIRGNNPNFYKNLEKLVLKWGLLEEKGIDVNVYKQKFEEEYKEYQSKISAKKPIQKPDQRTRPS